MKYQEIVDGNWDYLIILDACRYDDFKELHTRYLDGKLEKRLSRGSNTLEWLSQTFKNRMDDVAYISANPHVNSKAFSLGETTSSISRFSNPSWNAVDKFGKIIDVWDYGNNKNIGCVHPLTLTEEALRYIEKNNNRAIIHYIQPHEPYFISNEKGGGDTEGIKHVRDKTKKAEQGDKTQGGDNIIKRLLKPIAYEFFKVLPICWQHRVKKLVGAKTDNMREYICKKDINDLRMLYKANIEITLNQVSRLVERIPEDKKIVITADHGEAFGEGKIFRHPGETQQKEVIEVPWLEIVAGENKETYVKKLDKKKGKDTKDEEKIKERLKSLGYMGG